MPSAKTPNQLLTKTQLQDSLTRAAKLNFNLYQEPSVYFYKAESSQMNSPDFCLEMANGCCCIVYNGFAQAPGLYVFFLEDGYDLGSNWQKIFTFKLKYNGSVIFERYDWPDFTEPPCLSFGWGRGVGPFNYCGGLYEVTVQKGFKKPNGNVLYRCSESTATFIMGDPPNSSCFQ